MREKNVSSTNIWEISTTLLLADMLAFWKFLELDRNAENS